MRHIFNTSPSVGKTGFLQRQVLPAMLATWLLLGYNAQFFSATWSVYAKQSAWGFLISLALLLWLSLFLCIQLLLWGRWSRYLLIVLLWVAAVAAYFMDTYGVVISSEMLLNTVKTDAAEVRDLLSWQLALYLSVLGLLPTIVLLRTAKNRFSWNWRSLWLDKPLCILIWVLALAMAVGLQGKNYGSFIRVNKVLRYYTNPFGPLYASVRYLEEQQHRDPIHRSPTLTDAKRTDAAHKPKIFVLVVGETARADHWSLNGYTRNTNPQLSTLPVVSLQNATACGTSTAISVPCMFYTAGVDDFSLKKARQQENILDVLARLGMYIEWRDNNSDSKGVAEGNPLIVYRDYRSNANNPLCNPECRDEGMLQGLAELMRQHHGRDVLVVLHQMGSHGPAYFKRYPTAFERFTPVCTTALLEQCERQNIINAYDNTLIYTDHFLAQLIRLLDKTGSHAEKGLLYMSDHGESLGEGGIYLHGLMRALAPREQLHIPALLWRSSWTAADSATLSQRINSKAWEHDAITHTLLGWFGIHTKHYIAAKDLFAQ